MYQEAIDRVRRSIFPVFFQAPRGNLTRIGVSGTGFFLTDEGHFITAYHVITDVPAAARLLYIGNVPDNPLNEPFEIEEVWSDAARDIFVGRAAEEPLPAIGLAPKGPRPGKSVCLSGYPLSRLSQNPDGTINVSNVRPYWQPTFVVDGISADINQRHYQGFITQHTSLRGMSGGPIFDSDGLVYGIDVATLTRNIPEPDGRETIVPNGVAIGIDEIRELLAGRIPLASEG